MRGRYFESSSLLSSRVSLPPSFFMDWLILLGVFISGLGIGLTLVGQRKEPSERHPCSCECHCPAPSVERQQGLLTVKDLLLVIGFFTIILVIIWFGYQLQKPQKPEPGIKGKGKRGVFGGGIALSIRDGPDASR